ncbi:MAG: discoidin domain-containing protein [Armatimonadota bacterium]
MENIALGCPVSVDPPNYFHAGVGINPQALTDGIYCPKDVFPAMWADARTLGWWRSNGFNMVPITIDLGKVQPVSGLSYSTAAGSGDVAWPLMILVTVSDDSVTWRFTGDLIESALIDRVPPVNTGYATYRFSSGNMPMCGRYIRLTVVPQGIYTFCDEVEIYKDCGESRENEFGAPVVEDIVGFAKSRQLRAHINWRMCLDAAAARLALQMSGLSEKQKAELCAVIDKAIDDNRNLPPPEMDTFKTILPLNDSHAKIYSVYAPIMRSRGLPELIAWRKNSRCEPIKVNEVPESPVASPAVSIRMMKNEFRADAFCLTNASGKPVLAKLRVCGLPDCPRPKWLRISSVPWTDTAQKVPVAYALPDAPYSDGSFAVSIPSGVTRRIWLTVNSSHLSPGTHKGYLEVTVPEENMRIPMIVQVSTVTMQQPRLHFSLWDYCEGDGAFLITKKNMKSARAILRSHFVDSPWATPECLPWPKAEDYNENNQLIKTLNWDRLDAWIAQWPDSRHYFVYVNKTEDTFAGAKVGTPEFDRRLGDWAKTLSNHIQSLGLRPKQMVLHIIDEAPTEAENRIIASWTQTIHAATNDIAVMINPYIVSPEKETFQEGFSCVDIMMPSWFKYKEGGQPAIQYYKKLRVSGQQFWFYENFVHASLNPYVTLRRLIWSAFYEDAFGVASFSFGQEGNFISSWNTYSGDGTVALSCVFIGAEEITDAVPLEAVREGVEDYEYLAMLKDAALATKNLDLRAKAEALIAESGREVLGKNGCVPYELATNDCGIADVYRLRVLDILEAMR